MIEVSGIGELAPFRPALADQAPEEVEIFRAAIEAAPLLLLAVPEYAGGMSGVAKNALDWCVGSASLYERAIAVVSAGTTGGPHAIEQTCRTLAWQGAQAVATLSLPGARSMLNEQHEIADAYALDQIRSWVRVATDAAGGDTNHRWLISDSVLRSIGIQPRPR